MPYVTAGKENGASLDNASPKAGDLYAALDMPWAGLVGQLAGAFVSKK